MISEDSESAAAAKRLAWAFCLLAVLLGRGSGAWRRGKNRKPKPYALIFGTVFDPEGQPLYAVKVKIRRASEKKKFAGSCIQSHWRVCPARASGPGRLRDMGGRKGIQTRRWPPLPSGQEVKVHIDGDERQDIGLHLAWQ